MRVLQVCDRMELGGAESHIITLSQSLVATGHEVYITSSAGPAVARLANTGITHIELPLSDSSKQFECAAALIDLIREHRIDIVHAHPFHSHAVASIACSVTNVPLVVTWHGPYRTGTLSPLIASVASRYIAVSEEVVDVLSEAGIRSQSVMHIPNSVPVLKEPNRGGFFCKGRIRVAFISRLDKDKLPSVKLLFRHLSSLRDLPLDIYIVGDGQCTDYVGRVVESVATNASSTVTLLGPVVDVDAVIRSCDIVIGMGRVVLEALALGKFALCLGYESYVGIITADVLRMISKVNFTDRNSVSKLDASSLDKDIRSIFQDFGHHFCLLCDTCAEVRESFSIEASTATHVGLYDDAIAAPAQEATAGTVADIISAVCFPYPIGPYYLDGAKATRLLLQPDFGSPEYAWQDTLRDVLVRYGPSDPVTIVIRVANQFHWQLDSILPVLSAVTSEIEDCPDVLVDIDYHDEQLEQSFLRAIDYYLPTGDISTLFRLKCIAAGVRELSPSQ